MTEFGKIIYKCLKELNCDFSAFLNSKHERIKLQKYSYLIEKIFGLGVGRYSLYLNGPYNSTLADELYNIAHNEGNYINFMNENPLGQDSRQILLNIRSCFQDDNIDEVDLLELYTTYDYLRKYYPSYSDNDIYDKLCKEKHHLIERYRILNIREMLSKIDSRMNQLIAG